MSDPNGEARVVGKFTLEDGSVVQANSEHVFWGLISFAGKTGLQFARLTARPGALRVDPADLNTWEVDEEGADSQIWTDRTMPDGGVVLQLLVENQCETGPELERVAARYEFVGIY